MRTIRLSLLFAFVVAVVGYGTPAHAATITVTTLDDELNSDSDCSLREAIRSANSDGADPHDACEAGSGDDIINVPAGTITLDEGTSGEDAAEQGDLDLTDDVTINGAGARTTFIDGGDIDRVFDAAPSEAAISVTFNNLTIRNGNEPAECGGGIDSKAGTLELFRVAVLDNVAGCGGGVAVYAGSSGPDTLTIRESLIARNIAGDDDNGGGVHIQSLGAVINSTIENVTVSGNEAQGQGGGLWQHDSSGTTLITTTLNNVTVADNQADSDGDSGATGDDGGGVSNTGDAVLRASNTIIGDNTDASTGTGGNDFDDCSGTLTSDGYNLIESTTGCTITGPGPGDITGQDPGLQQLADEGGPTDTHQLKNNSPAIDTGNPAASDGTGSHCEPVDQRGFARPRGPRCDIGAFERGAGEQPKCLNKKVTLEGTPGPDTLTGTSKRDVIAAGEGDDTINTLGGNDFVCAAGGNDRIRTGGGTDQVVGELGNDRVRSGPAGDTASGNGGRDRLIGGGGADLLKGGRARDRLIGGGGDDSCKGGPGKDKIRRC